MENQQEPVTDRSLHWGYGNPPIGCWIGCIGAIIVAIVLVLGVLALSAVAGGYYGTL